MVSAPRRAWPVPAITCPVGGRCIHGPAGQAQSQGSRTRAREQAQAQAQGCGVGAVGLEHGAGHSFLWPQSPALAHGCTPKHHPAAACLPRALLPLLPCSPCALSAPAPAQRPGCRRRPRPPAQCTRPAPMPMLRSHDEKGKRGDRDSYPPIQYVRHGNFFQISFLINPKKYLPTRRWDPQKNFKPKIQQGPVLPGAI
jgi:hypothetical protein